MCGLPGHGGREHQRVSGEHVDQSGQAVLVELHEAEQHEGAGEEVRDVETQVAHQNSLDTNSSSVPSSPSITAAPRKSGTRNTRIFAIAVSKSASRVPAAASLSP